MVTDNNTETLTQDPLGLNGKSSGPVDQDDWQYWAKLISGTWQSSVGNIIETGRLLIKAKARLNHGEFTDMIKKFLPFKERTAQRLMQIAKNEVLSKASHVTFLPAHYATLAALDTLALPPAELEAKIRDGTINAKMERADVAKLKRKPALADDDDDPKPDDLRRSPMAKLKQENAELKRQVAHLEERLAASETALIQVDLIKDSVPNISGVFKRNLNEGKMSANKIETIARGLLTLLKSKTKETIQ